MLIDAIKDDLLEHLPYLNLPKLQFRHFPQVQAAIQHHLESLHNHTVTTIAIPSNPTPLERFLYTHGLMFPINQNTSPRDFTFTIADPNHPKVIVCKNACGHIWKGVKNGVKKLGKNIKRKVKRIGREISRGGRKAGHWVKEHKTEVIIGAIVVAIIAAAILLPQILPALAAVPAAFPDNDTNDDHSKKPTTPTSSSPNPFSTTPRNNPLSHSSDLDLNKPLDFSELHYRPWETPFPKDTPSLSSPSNNLLASLSSPPSQIPSYTPSSQVTPPPVYQRFFGFIDHDSPPRVYIDPQGNSPPNPPAHLFTVPGKRLDGKLLLGINGMDNSYEEAVSHGQYTNKLSGGYEIKWVYSPTYGRPGDVIKAGAELIGHVSPEALLLRQEIQAFHDQHANNPNAKCFVSCFSRASIDVKNALEGLSHEVQQRVIVVAVAPATVVPKKMCYRSFNYSSKNDPVPHLQTWGIAGFGLESGLTPEIYQNIHDENHRELIILEPHPGETNFGHGYQQPGFEQLLEEHINKFLEGDYDYELLKGEQ